MTETQRLQPLHHIKYLMLCSINICKTTVFECLTELTNRQTQDLIWGVKGKAELSSVMADNL